MVRLAASTLRRITDLLALVTEVPGTSAYLVDEGRLLIGDLEERLPPPRSAEESAGVEVDEVLMTRVSAFLDLLGGTPSTPPDLARDARDIAARMWETTDTFRLIDIADAAKRESDVHSA